VVVLDGELDHRAVAGPGRWVGRLTGQGQRQPEAHQATVADRAHGLTSVLLGISWCTWCIRRRSSAPVSPREPTLEVTVQPGAVLGGGVPSDQDRRA
jgi:hypothetical protein